MKIGIAVDDWKLAIFEKHLKNAGIEYTQGAGVTSDTLMLYVESDSPNDVVHIIKAANQEAARSKRH